MKHIKPTAEELEAKAQEALKEAEALKNKPSPSSPVPSPSKEVPSPSPEAKPTPSPSEPIVSPSPSEPIPSEPEPSKELYKKKFSASSRENQKIYAKNRKLNQAIEEANEIPEPTDEEMLAEYPSDWEMMSDFEQKIARETLISKRFRERIAKAQDEVKKIEKWDEEIIKFVEDPKTLIDNPELEGKEEDFTKFASEDINNSVPFKILVAAFLHESQKSVKPKNKGAMFETGSGGPNEKPKPKSDKLTIEEGRRLRKSNYNRWKEYLVAGKIENEEI